MTRYVNVKGNISEGQKEKLQHAIKASWSAVSIRLGHEDLEGNDILAILTVCLLIYLFWELSCNNI